tara:strand:- start:9337 stop:10230 length:894 start_codon:yes stop_codon:yes gene_type:complete
MKRASLLFILGTLYIGCAKPTSTTEVVLARVGNSELTLKEVRKQIPDSSILEDSIGAFNLYRDQWIERQLVLQEANRLNILSSPDVKDRLKSMREEVIINSFQQAVMNTNSNSEQVTKQEARRYYQENKDKFVLDERYIRFRHLIAESLSDAESAKRNLMAGISWDKVAEQYCIYPELKIRESEHFFPENTTLKDYTVLNRYLKIIGISEISRIEKIGTQYHFVQLIEERVAGEHPDLDWLVDQIQNWLTLEKKRRSYNSYLKNLYLEGQANNEIVTFDVLPEPTAMPVKNDTLNLN